MTLLGLYLCIFITLKITNFIDWSWWWVLSPLWIPIVGFLFIALIGYMFGGKK